MMSSWFRTFFFPSHFWDFGSFWIRLISAVYFIQVTFGLFFMFFGFFFDLELILFCLFTKYLSKTPHGWLLLPYQRFFSFFFLSKKRRIDPLFTVFSSHYLLWNPLVSICNIYFFCIYIISLSLFLPYFRIYRISSYAFILKLFLLNVFYSILIHSVHF